MFYIKSDNIEELFREAAEKYHIDTAGAEAWDDVEAAVHADDMPPPPPPEQKRKRRWFVFMWFLLIPLGWFSHNIWTALSEPRQNEQKTAQTTKKNAAQNFDTSSALPLKATDNKSPAANTQSENTQPAVATTKLNNTNYEKHPFAAQYGYKPAVKQASSFMHVKQASIATNNDYNAKPGSKLPELGLLAGGTQSNTPPVGENAVELHTQTTGLQRNSGNIAKFADTTALAKTMAQDTAATAKTHDKTSNLAGDDSNTNGNQNHNIKPKSSHYFYVGLSVAPDVSFIHFQKTSVLGLGAGVLLGYHINNKLSVETGLMLDKKNYYTAGKYFDKSKLPYGNNINLKDVEGYCKMAEIPINIRYTFNTKATHSFYGIAGLSSYIMGNQFYEYGYTWMTNYYSKIYRSEKVAVYPFSVVNLGIGYEKKIGHNTNIRIEPYMKVPLAGLGAGSLKIASTGLYVTLTKKIP